MIGGPPDCAAGSNFTLSFLDIFVLLGPASASNQEEMLGSSEEPLPKGFVLDSGAVLIR